MYIHISSATNSNPSVDTVLRHCAFVIQYENGHNLKRFSFKIALKKRVIISHWLISIESASIEVLERKNETEKETNRSSRWRTSIAVYLPTDIYLFASACVCVCMRRKLNAKHKQLSKFEFGVDDSDTQPYRAHKQRMEIAREK